jgi:histidinol-phosphate aminotransferase
MLANVARIERERLGLRQGLTDAGWSVPESETNFLVADFETPERAAAVAEGLLRRGLVPRTFGAGHLLAHCLRLTVRDANGNGRLVAAAQDLAREGTR